MDGNPVPEIVKPTVNVNTEPPAVEVTVVTAFGTPVPETVPLPNPVGPALETVELGSGNGTVADPTENELLFPPAVKGLDVGMPVPSEGVAWPLMVGPTVEFDNVKGGVGMGKLETGGKPPEPMVAEVPPVERAKGLVVLDVGNGGGRVGPDWVVAPVPPVTGGAVPNDATLPLDDRGPVPTGTDDGDIPVPVPVLPSGTDEFAVGSGKEAVIDGIDDVPTPLVGKGPTVEFPPGNGGADAVPEEAIVTEMLLEKGTELITRLEELGPRLEATGAVPVPTILLELPKGNDGDGDGSAVLDEKLGTEAAVPLGAEGTIDTVNTVCEPETVVVMVLSPVVPVGIELFVSGNGIDPEGDEEEPVYEPVLGVGTIDTPVEFAGVIVPPDILVTVVLLLALLIVWGAADVVEPDVVLVRVRLPDAGTLLITKFEEEDEDAETTVALENAELGDEETLLLEDPPYEDDVDVDGVDDDDRVNILPVAAAV
ncbi:hypothetical protein SLS62_007919 [Diatrype stigma]|uniref:Uncharacterized protein n=1 Tax=Diatrype stigma TaxID=117547 RepID=A0AAN9YLX7_9PEZI